MIRIASAVAVALALCAHAAAGRVQGESKVADVTMASKVELESLLSRYAKAEESEDASEVVAALVKMTAHNNVELLAPAAEALKYKASKLDKNAVKDEAYELGIRHKGEIARMIAACEAEVQALAAKLIGNIPGKRSTSLLMRSFKDKKIRKDKPSVVGALIDSMGRLDYDKATDAVDAEFRAEGEKEVMRACVRYFGQIKCKDKGVVRTLCMALSAPEPGNVDSPSNPPASYWETRWKQWNHYRRDVTWALKQITGQTFKPAEGKHPGDTKKALDYVKAHARELGIK